MSGTDSKDGARVDLPRSSKRFGPDSSHGRSNPFNAMSPMSAGVSSPSTNASSAFGLGTGAFASFGAPKTPGGSTDVKTPGEKRDLSDLDDASAKALASSAGEHQLKSTWIVWYRPPTPKYSDYEKSTVPLAAISSVESLWAVYTHLKRPSLLPTVSDYHIFKKGIRPVWEDEANKRGGKWIVRLKKGVADRYWEDLLLAMAGDQFAEAGDEVCGAVLSVRGGEDVLSVWTRIDGGRNIKIRYVSCQVLQSYKSGHGLLISCAEKRSSVCSHFPQIPTSSGRATTTVLPNARRSTKLARRKLQLQLPTLGPLLEPSGGAPAMTTRTRARGCKDPVPFSSIMALSPVQYSRPTKTKNLIFHALTHWDAFGSGGRWGIEANSAV